MLLTIGMFIAAFAVIWLMLVFLLLIHESGHLIPMQKMGIKPDKLIIGGLRLFSFRKSGIIHEVGLIPLWAYVVSTDYEKASSRQRAIIAAGGPLMSALTGILFFGVYYLYPNWQTLVAAQGSILLAVTNIIPLPSPGWMDNRRALPEAARDPHRRQQQKSSPRNRDRNRVFDNPGALINYIPMCDLS
ncbi:site-2 protease family protein [Pseudomonas helleri]|uniref:site-2 protease family protein n=1 Tax=Pseudomonas helleri TaxID=1608996 RepID=UPI003FD0E211